MRTSRDRLRRQCRGAVSGRSTPGDVTSRWYGAAMSLSCWSNASDTARLTAGVSSSPTPASESMTTRINRRWPARSSSRFSSSNPVPATASRTTDSIAESGFAECALTVASWVRRPGVGEVLSGEVVFTGDGAVQAAPARRTHGLDHLGYRVARPPGAKWITVYEPVANSGLARWSTVFQARPSRRRALAAGATTAALFLAGPTALAGCTVSATAPEAPDPLEPPARRAEADVALAAAVAGAHSALAAAANALAADRAAHARTLRAELHRVHPDPVP